MRRAPDNQDVIDDDSGSYDVRELRGRKLDPDEVDLIVRAVQKIRPQVNYSESGDARLLKWVLGLISSLAVGGIVGGIGVYGTIQSVQATVQAIRDDTNRRLERIENRLDGRSGITRGGPDDAIAR